MDNYDYVMFGRIFKYKDAPSQGQVCHPLTKACMMRMAMLELEAVGAPDSTAMGNDTRMASFT